MKLLIALLWGAGAGCTVWALAAGLSGVQAPSKSFATDALRRAVESHLLSKRWPLVGHYMRHLQHLVQEVPLPPGLDLSLFVGLQLFLGVVLWSLAALALGSFNPLFLMPCLFAGMTGSYYWLRRRRDRLHTALLRALPESLDLMALVMEAGLDVTAGIQQYVERGRPGHLRDYFAQLFKETQMGRSRVDALYTLGQRTTFVPLRDVARGLAQALSLGTALTPFLREQALMLRQKRMQIAEKKAAEAPLKVLFPLFVFIFPTVFIILFGPVMILFLKGGF
jgi:tight adherence protein C